VVRLTLDEYLTIVRDVTESTYTWMKRDDLMHPEDLACHVTTVADSVAYTLSHGLVKRAAERAVPKDRPSASTSVHERTFT